MKKSFLMSLVFVMMFSLSACGSKNANTSKEEASKKQEAINLSLAQWVKSGKAVQCTVDSPEGKVKLAVKGDLMRMEGIPYVSAKSSGEMPKAENGVVLTAGDMTYMWDKEAKKGTKMNMKEMDEMYPDEEEEQETQDWGEVVENWDEAGFAYECQETKLDDDYFEEPEDVEFEDLNEMMNNMMDMSNKMQSGEMSMEELQKMMQEQGMQ